METEEDSRGKDTERQQRKEREGWGMNGESQRNGKRSTETEENRGKGHGEQDTMGREMGRKMERKSRDKEVETLRKEMKKIRTGERHNGIFLRGPGKRL